MKFIARIDLSKKRPEDRITTFFYNEPGPLPPIIDPADPEEAKDGGVPEPEEKRISRPAHKHH